MNILIKDTYKDSRKGIHWPPGRIIEVDPKDWAFLKVDAPDCFIPIPEGWDEQTRTVVQLVLNKGTDEDLAGLIELLGSPEAQDEKAMKEMVNFMLDSIKAGPAAAPAAPSSEVDEADAQDLWDGLTVKQLAEYLAKFPEDDEEVKALGARPKKGDIVEFLEARLGKVVIPLNAMIIPSDVVLK